MLKGRRRQLYAIGGGLGLALVLLIGFPTQPSDRLPEIPQGEVTAERSAEYEGSVTCHEDCQVTFGVDTEDNLGTDESDESAKAETYSASKLAYLDLIAQRRMAHWAIILALLTAIGAGLLIATLLETANATDAAVNTERTTREIGEAQARSYLRIAVARDKSFNFDDLWQTHIMQTYYEKYETRDERKPQGDKA